MLKGLFMMSEELFETDYPPQLRKKMKESIELFEPVLTPDNYKNHWNLIEKADVIFSGMGAIEMNKTFLDRAPNLKAIFYAAGSVKYMFTDDEVWRRNIVVSTANAVNAIPVAEFTVAHIILSLNNSWYLARKVRKEKTFTHGNDYPIPGAYDTTVGIISLGAIGRLVVKYLKPYAVNILAYDPFIDKNEATKLGVQLTSLEDVFQKSHVVSLHSPRLPETMGMITGDLLQSMKEYASFINTARGDIVKESEMIEVLKNRPDLTALLDVTSPEPPSSDSPLYTLENVFLTPHIAGSVGKERQRQGEEMFAEFKRFLNKQPLKHQITQEDFNKMA